MIVIDGKNQIVGRVASEAAENILDGKEVRIINAEDMVIVGNPKKIREKYQERRELKDRGKPENSPFWPKVPNKLVKRIVRGMVPNKPRGRKALKKLKVYNKEPKDQNKKLEPNHDPHAEFDGFSDHLTIIELCKKLGYNG